MDIGRGAVQAILSVLIVGGILTIIALDREGRPPYEALFSLVGGIVGFYFGSAFKPSDDNESEKRT